ncbi:MAG TPA: exonuclease domain-containing protein [bacterium]|jgi:DNA polymerase-3 subunit alpha (Gram-positive type)
MRQSTFVVFDTETTGLYAGYDQLVEIAACRICDGTVIDDFETLVNPERDIPQEISDIHGITEEMVSGAPACSEAVTKFLDYVNGDELVAHNAPFDENFISFNCHKYKIEPPVNNIYDTLILTRRLFPELKSHGLAALTNIFDISHEVKHRGMPDVMGTRGVFLECISRLERHGIKSKQQFDVWYGDPLRFSPEKYGLLVSLPEEYSELRKAVEGGQLLEVDYEDRTTKRTRRIIAPQGLFVAHGNLYLTAYCHLRQANRNFKLERIHAFRILDTPVISH